MPSTSLAVAKAANASTKLAFKPVAVFVGATSGIGKGTAEAFARHTNGNATIIISGRNEAAARKIIQGFPTSASSKYEFLSCDASKLSNVVTACKALKEEHGITKINYLFMSQGFLTSPIAGYDDNGEGLDKKLCVHYYSRFKFFIELAPLLLAAKEAGEEARVVSVFAAGQGNDLDRDDVGMKKTYSTAKCGRQAPTYNDLTVEALAKKYPTLSFAHVFPGTVATNLAKSSGSYLMNAISPLISPFLTSTSDCGEWMTRSLLDPAYAKGAFHLDQHGDSYPNGKIKMPDEDQKLMFDHFMEVASKF